jgi:hypothetical protein
MRAGRRRRIRIKSKRARQALGRHRKASHPDIRQDDTNQFEPAHRLLLSSLRYWEIERDLIDERVGAIGQ